MPDHIIPPRSSRYKRIAWLAFKLISLVSVLVASILISPHLSARRRNQFTRQIAWDFEIWGMKTVTPHTRRILFPKRMSRGIRLSNASAWGLDRLQRHFEQSEYAVIEALEFDGTEPLQFNRFLNLARDLPFLETVVIRKADCSECDLTTLRKFTQVDDLRFHYCRIDRETIRSLQSMSSLYQLEFIDCEFDSDAISAISGLKQVYWTRVGKTVSIEAIQSLRKKMPSQFVTR